MITSDWWHCAIRQIARQNNSFFSARIDLKTSLWIWHLTFIYEFIVAVTLGYNCTRQGFQIRGEKSGSTLTGQENDTPTALHQTCAQLLNDGIQLSIETMGAIWTQSVRQCRYWGSRETTAGWSKSNMAITNEEVRKSETEKERGKQANWRKIKQERQCTTNIVILRRVHATIFEAEK